MADVFSLQSYEISDNWPWISRFLERIEGAEWKLADVYEALTSEQAQLWGMREESRPVAIWITKLCVTGCTKWGLLWIAAGKGLEAGLELYRKHTEPWLKAKGCEFVQILGRKGWERAMPDYQHRGIILVKPL